MSSEAPVLRLGATTAAPLHVLIVSPAVTPPWTNGTTVLVKNLSDAGASWHYRLMGQKGQPAPSPGTSIEPIYGDGDQHPLLTQARLAARLLRPDRVSLHHWFFAPHPRAVRLARLARFASRKRCVHTIPSQPAPELDLARACFADRTVVLTEATAVMLQQAGVPNVSVIRPAVPLPPGALVAGGREAARRRLALSTGEPWGEEPAFLYPGDLEFSDGARVFVDAAIQLAAELPDARFVLACRPKTPRAAHVRDELQRLIHRAGLRDRITFLGVAPDFAALLAAVDAVVMPVDTLYAKVDTPLALLEAMALGTPAVVSDIPPLAELAGLGEGVCMVPRSNPELLASKMHELAASPALRHSLGQGARRTVATHFDPRSMAASYEALYRELVNA